MSTNRANAGVNQASFTDSVMRQYINAPEPLLSSIYYIYQAILSIQNNIAVIGNDIQENSSAQNAVNNQLSAYQYLTIPPDTLYKEDGTPDDKVPSAYLQNLSAYNQSISATRQGIQNQLNSLSNAAQINTGNLNTDVNILQQSLQVGQALIQSFSQIVSLIGNI